MSELTVAMQGLPMFFAKGSVDAGEIKKAEEDLQVSFSQEYIDYVTEYGFITWRGHELTGICQAKRLNVVDVTQEERENNPEISNNLYVIEQTHIGNIVIWQDEIGTIFRTDYQSQPKKIAESLREYLKL